MSEAEGSFAFWCVYDNALSSVPLAMFQSRAVALSWAESWRANHPGADPILENRHIALALRPFKNGLGLFLAYITSGLWSALLILS